MICPHCKKPIPLGSKRWDEKLKAKCLKLHSEGYASRDIERMIDARVSFVTITRWVKEAKGKG